MSASTYESKARLRARSVAHHTAPDDPAPPQDRGLLPLGLACPRDGLIYVPTTHPLEGPRPLIVACHGAGSEASHSIKPFVDAAEAHGLLLLACDSRAQTWDMIGGGPGHGGYGPDVEFIDRALALMFSRYDIDPNKIVLDGFSDGASYALLLGLNNGDLFTHLMGFSPGFIALVGQVGRPKIFVSHGTTDRILPIDRCGRVIARQLTQAGYDLHYTEFEGGHTVPPEVQREALDWLGV